MQCEVIYLDQARKYNHSGPNNGIGLFLICRSLLGCTLGQLTLKIYKQNCKRHYYPLCRFLYAALQVPPAGKDAGPQIRAALIGPVTIPENRITKMDCSMS